MIQDKSRIVKSDIFKVAQNIIHSKNLGHTIIIPHVCNNMGLFGAGFAAAVRKSYPVVATNFELLGRKTKLGYVQYVSVIKDQEYLHELIFANMIAQNGTISQNNPRPLNYEALVKCMVDVRNYIQSLDKEKVQIHCPKFGSGLAGGNWQFIEYLISDIWKELPVCIYKL
jgi:hypothetical protein